MSASEYEPKPFACHTCGWIVGESYREPSSRVTQLRVLRRALPQMLIIGTLPEVFYCVIQVNDCTVVCDHCGGHTSWFANQTAIEEMLTRKRARRKAQNERIA